VIAAEVSCWLEFYSRGANGLCRNKESQKQRKRKQPRRQNELQRKLQERLKGFVCYVIALQSTSVGNQSNRRSQEEANQSSSSSSTSTGDSMEVEEGWEVVGKKKKKR